MIPATLGLVFFGVFACGYILGWMNRGNRVFRRQASTFPDRIKFITPRK